MSKVGDHTSTELYKVNQALLENMEYQCTVEARALKDHLNLYEHLTACNC